MGRKSKLKQERSQERRLLAAAVRTAQYALDPNPPTTIYRFFEEEQYADALVDGLVWLSTLETCRRYESVHQGDEQEGTLLYNSGTISGDGRDCALGHVAHKLGIDLSPLAGRVLLRNSGSSSRIPDAWVLCTTERFEPDGMAHFGAYCVAINHPTEFFHRVNATIEAEHPIRRQRHGRVRYVTNSYQGVEPVPGEIGFVKSPDKFAYQREYRMLWRPMDSAGIHPLGWQCDGVRELVRRIK